MDNAKVLKEKIKEAFILKTNRGQMPKEVKKQLSSQLYNFLINNPNFTSANVSRGMRDIILEENRNYIIEAMVNVYLNHINDNDILIDMYDRYIKQMLTKTNDVNDVMNTILTNNELIRRMR